MDKSKNIVTGTVVEALPNTEFRVQVDDTEEVILSFLSGRMKLHHIRVVVGDKVAMELDPYGGKARINKRL